MVSFIITIAKTKIIHHKIIYKNDLYTFFLKITISEQKVEIVVLLIIFTRFRAIRAVVYKMRFLSCFTVWPNLRSVVVLMS